MDADIVEIPPPIHLLNMQKRAILQDVIDIDNDDDSEDLVIIGEKAILHDVIDIDDDDDSKDLVIIGEKVSESNKRKTIETIHQVMEVSDYTFCQPGLENFGPVSGIESSNGYPLAHLDNVDTPLGTEAPFIWLPENDLGLKKRTFKNGHWYDTQSDAKNSHVSDSSQPSWSLEPSSSKIQGSTMGGSNLQIKTDNVDHSSGTEFSSPQLFSQAAPSKKKSAASQRRGRGLNLSLGEESSKSKRFLKSFRSKMKSASFGSKNHGLAGNPEARKLLHAAKPPAATKFKSAKKAAGSSSSYHSNFKDEILRKFRSFKQFDTVSDASDHHFVRKNSSMKQHPKNWAKRIQKEWQILEKDLPDSIFVRVYESRMDLLRAVIIGAEGTPYHDGLFFFDLYFPSDYPDEPPVVYFHSGGFSLNPNLDESGAICLSLLSTLHGSSGNECWLPGVSTILQVLVSMQGLVLNTMPYFYLTGRESMRGSAYAKRMSLVCNEETFIESLRTMMYMIRGPPKNFEDFVVGHFVSRAHDILAACNAYIKGAQVGSLVKGAVQGVDVGGKSCSRDFQDSLIDYINELVKEFARIGAKDCKKFLSAAGKAYNGAFSI